MNDTEGSEKDGEDNEFEVVQPNPAALIESLRSFGYTLESSIADLIDNSITANASEIGIQLNWQGPESTLSILDNGEGMTADELRAAMRPGSMNPLKQREKKDLGRFGLGLKTASFSQARHLVVASKPRGGAVTVRRWDLDHVGRTGEWQLLVGATESTENEIRRLDDLESGTIVIWERLDRVVDNRPSDDRVASTHFYDSVALVDSHVGMVFHRFLSRRSKSLRISVNGNKVEAWDPFLAGHSRTQIREKEQLPTPHGKVVVQPYVLPHHSHLTKEEHRLASGIRGWNSHQGFYVYRADRLLVSGTWFHGDTKAEEHYKLARISIDITQEMDQDWDIDVRKARARPPAALRVDLRRIARNTRSKAAEVYRHRGKRLVKTSPVEQRKPVWVQHRRDGRITYRVNKDHDLVKEVLSLPLEQRRQVRAVIELLERTLPVPTIVMDAYEHEQEQNRPDDTPLSTDLVTVAKSLYVSYIRSGESAESAKLLVMTLEPFADYPELVAEFETGEA